jgi:hypothetical protein
MAIGHENRWIFRPFPDDSPSETLTKELPRTCEVANT